MGTKERKERERNERRIQIQQSAKELFLQNGFISTTMEQIAEKAELALGTIYNYFKNKDELYVSLILGSLNVLIDDLEKISKNNELTVEEKILEIKEAHYRVYRYDPLTFRNIVHMQVMDSLLAVSSEMVDKLNRQARKNFSLMAGIYEEGVRQDKFIEGHAMAHAEIMWGLFTGVLLWEETKLKFNPQNDFLESTLNTAFDTYLRGIRKNRD